MTDSSGADDTATVFGVVTPQGQLPLYKKVPDAAPLVIDVRNPDNTYMRVDFWREANKSLDVTYVENLLMKGHKHQEYDMNQFIEGIIYQGFNREFYIKHTLTKMSLMMFSQFALVGSIRGSNFQKIVDTSEDFPEGLKNAFASLSFVKKPKKKTDLTILRCTASIPQWCAYWMKKAQVDKKISTEECPACLQFPGAASLPMSKKIRLQHLAFSIAFSKILPGGAFSLSIYLTAYNNSIPVKYIPDGVKQVLEVFTEADAKALSADEISKNALALAPTKP
jgi:hypothetical protein